MNTLRIVTAIAALLLAAGEIARWWGDARFLPLAFDELLIAAALLAASAIAGRAGPMPLGVAWGAFCGFTASLLVPTLDHLMSGPPKASAGFYAVVLAVMLAAGLAALGWAVALNRARSRVR
ncbi:hypothetical protein [Emcibacter sp. SYSU 3D8]|uniref:hypothetical protein n=1 Tax=Emcibacter sp. SYSU 3D8 TaxID=3133969 RepID=UPI0031FEF554